MARANARVLLEGYAIHEQPYNADDVYRALQRLAAWMLRHAPQVATDGLDSLLLDLTGCARLCGPVAQHLGSIGHHLDKLGLVARLAAAPTYGAAWALAHFGRHQDQVIVLDSSNALEQSLGLLPIAALRIEPPLRNKLYEVDLTRIDDVLRLPRTALVKRFGPELLQRLDQALGRIPETPLGVTPEEHWRVTRSFELSVRQADIISNVVDQLLDALLDKLRRALLGVCGLRLVLKRANDTPLQFNVPMTHPSRDRAHLWRLLTPKLEKLALGFGVDEIQLAALRIERLSAPQTHLWGADAQQEREDDASAHGELLDRLIDQLGNEAVQQITPVEAYFPEQAFATRRVTQRKTREDATILNYPRPTRLLPQPEALEVLMKRPDGAPGVLQFGGHASRVVIALGPERIAAPWWVVGSRFKAVRDYYRIADERGRFLWVFHDAELERWFVHGEWL